MERTELIQSLLHLVETGPPVVVVSGTSGSGRTTLVRAAIDRVGTAAVLASCDPLDPPVPGGPFQGLRIGDSDLAGLVRDGDLDRAADIVAEAVGGGLLVVDDATWIDQASARLVVEVVERLEDATIVIVDDSDDHDPVLGAALASIGDHAQVAVTPLSIDQIAELLPDGMDPEQTRERTGGDALTVIEAAAAGTAELDLRSMVLARFDGLTLSTREIVEALAVSATGMDRALLERLHPGWQTNLAPAEESDLVSVGPDDVAFTHERRRRIVLAELTEMRKRFLHQRILEHLDASADPAVEAAHADGAGDVERTIDAARRAATAAARAGSHVEAAGQLERAMRQEHSMSATERRQVEDEMRRQRELADRHLRP